MAYVTTLIAPAQEAFSTGYDEALRFLPPPVSMAENAGNSALDVVTATPVPRQALESIRAASGMDAVTQSLAHREKRLFLADMDATMVEDETLDELATHAGIKEQIAAITAQAMNGHLDFAQALAARVVLLKGLRTEALEQTAARMRFTQGGMALLETCRRRGIHCILVSGGFTFFTQRVAQTLGFDAHFGNTLECADGLLTGRVIPPVLDKDFKKRCLLETAESMGIPLTQTMAIGDGANDIPMLQAAGLGVGFRSKPVLRAAIDNHILKADLGALRAVIG